MGTPPGTIASSHRAIRRIILHSTRHIKLFFILPIDFQLYDNGTKLNIDYAMFAVWCCLMCVCLFSSCALQCNTDLTFKMYFDFFFFIYKETRLILMRSALRSFIIPTYLIWIISHTRGLMYNVHFRNNCTFKTLFDDINRVLLLQSYV